VNAADGSLLGSVESQGNHGMDVLTGGDLVQAPGPDQVPQRYRSRM
jgi:hypothetical protein